MKYCVKIIIDLFQGKNILYYCINCYVFFGFFSNPSSMLTSHASNVFKKGSRHGVYFNNVTY